MALSQSQAANAAPQPYLVIELLILPSLMVIARLPFIYINTGIYI